MSANEKNSNSSSSSSSTSNNTTTATKEDKESSAEYQKFEEPSPKKQQQQQDLASSPEKSSVRFNLPASQNNSNNNTNNNNNNNGPLPLPSQQQQQPQNQNTTSLSASPPSAHDAASLVNTSIALGGGLGGSDQPETRGQQRDEEAFSGSRRTGIYFLSSAWCSLTYVILLFSALYLRQTIHVAILIAAVAKPCVRRIRGKGVTNTMPQSHTVWLMAGFSAVLVLSLIAVGIMSVSGANGLSYARDGAFVLHSLGIWNPVDHPALCGLSVALNVGLLGLAGLYQKFFGESAAISEVPEVAKRRRLHERLYLIRICLGLAIAAFARPSLLSVVFYVIHIIVLVSFCVKRTTVWKWRMLQGTFIFTSVYTALYLVVFLAYQNWFLRDVDPIPKMFGLTYRNFEKVLKEEFGLAVFYSIHVLCVFDVMHTARRIHGRMSLLTTEEAEAYVHDRILERATEVKERARRKHQQTGFLRTLLNAFIDAFPVLMLPGLVIVVNLIQNVPAFGILIATIFGFVAPMFVFVPALPALYVVCSFVIAYAFVSEVLSSSVAQSAEWMALHHEVGDPDLTRAINMLSLSVLAACCTCWVFVYSLKKKLAKTKESGKTMSALLQSKRQKLERALDVVEDKLHPLAVQFKSLCNPGSQCITRDGFSSVIHVVYGVEPSPEEAERIWNTLVLQSEENAHYKNDLFHNNNNNNNNTHDNVGGANNNNTRSNNNFLKPNVGGNSTNFKNNNRQSSLPPAASSSAGGGTGDTSANLQNSFSRALQFLIKESEKDDANQKQGGGSGDSSDDEEEIMLGQTRREEQSLHHLLVARAASQNQQHHAQNQKTPQRSRANTNMSLGSTFGDSPNPSVNATSAATAAAGGGGGGQRKRGLSTSQNQDTQQQQEQQHQQKQSNVNVSAASALAAELLQEEEFVLHLSHHHRKRGTSLMSHMSRTSSVGPSSPFKSQQQRKKQEPPSLSSSANFMGSAASISNFSPAAAAATISGGDGVAALPGDDEEEEENNQQQQQQQQNSVRPSASNLHAQFLRDVQNAGDNSEALKSDMIPPPPPIGLRFSGFLELHAEVSKYRMWDSNVFFVIVALLRDLIARNTESFSLFIMFAAASYRQDLDCIRMFFILVFVVFLCFPSIRQKYWSVLIAYNIFVILVLYSYSLVYKYTPSPKMIGLVPADLLGLRTLENAADLYVNFVLLAVAVLQLRTRASSSAVAAASAATVSETADNMNSNNNNNDASNLRVSSSSSSSSSSGIDAVASSFETLRNILSDMEWKRISETAATHSVKTRVALLITVVCFMAVVGVEDPSALVALFAVTFVAKLRVTFKADRPTKLGNFLSFFNAIYSVLALIAVSLYQFDALREWFTDFVGSFTLCKNAHGDKAQICAADLGFSSAALLDRSATFTLLPWFVASTSNIVLFTLSSTDALKSSSSSSSSSQKDSTSIHSSSAPSSSSSSSQASSSSSAQSRIQDAPWLSRPVHLMFMILAFIGKANNAGRIWLSHHGPKIVWLSLFIAGIRFRSCLNCIYIILLVLDRRGWTCIILGAVHLSIVYIYPLFFVPEVPGLNQDWAMFFGFPKQSGHHTLGAPVVVIICSLIYLQAKKQAAVLKPSLPKQGMVFFANDKTSLRGERVAEVKLQIEFNKKKREGVDQDGEQQQQLQLFQRPSIGEKSLRKFWMRSSVDASAAAAAAAGGGGSSSNNDSKAGKLFSFSSSSSSASPRKSEEHNQQEEEGEEMKSLLPSSSKKKKSSEGNNNNNNNNNKQEPEFVFDASVPVATATTTTTVPVSASPSASASSASSNNNLVPFTGYQKFSDEDNNSKKKKKDSGSGEVDKKKKNSDNENTNVQEEDEDEEVREQRELDRKRAYLRMLFPLEGSMMLPRGVLEHLVQLQYVVRRYFFSVFGYEMIILVLLVGIAATTERITAVFLFVVLVMLWRAGRHDVLTDGIVAFRCHVICCLLLLAYTMLMVGSDKSVFKNSKTNPPEFDDAPPMARSPSCDSVRWWRYLGCNIPLVDQVFLFFAICLLRLAYLGVEARQPLIDRKVAGCRTLGEYFLGKQTELDELRMGLRDDAEEVLPPLPHDVLMKPRTLPESLASIYFGFFPTAILAFFHGALQTSVVSIAEMLLGLCLIVYATDIYWTFFRYWHRVTGALLTLVAVQLLANLPTIFDWATHSKETTAVAASIGVLPWSAADVDTFSVVLQIAVVWSAFVQDRIFNEFFFAWKLQSLHKGSILAFRRHKQLMVHMAARSREQELIAETKEAHLVAKLEKIRSERLGKEAEDFFSRKMESGNKRRGSLKFGNLENNNNNNNNNNQDDEEEEASSAAGSSSKVSFSLSGKAISEQQTKQVFLLEDSDEGNSPSSISSSAEKKKSKKKQQQLLEEQEQEEEAKELLAQQQKAPEQVTLLERIKQIRSTIESKLTEYILSAVDWLSEQSYTGRRPALHYHITTRLLMSLYKFLVRRTGDLCVLAFAINFAESGSIADMMLCVSGIIHALVVLPWCSEAYWEGALIYSVLSILVKSAIKICAENIEMTRSSQVAVSVLFLDLGVTRTIGNQAVPKNQVGSFAFIDILFDFFAFGSILLHRRFCVQNGVYVAGGENKSTEQYQRSKEDEERMLEQTVALDDEDDDDQEEDNREISKEQFTLEDVKKKKKKKKKIKKEQTKEGGGGGERNLVVPLSGQLQLEDSPKEEEKEKEKQQDEEEEEYEEEEEEEEEETESEREGHSLADLAADRRRRRMSGRKKKQEGEDDEEGEENDENDEEEQDEESENDDDENQDGEKKEHHHHHKKKKKKKKKTKKKKSSSLYETNILGRIRFNAKLFYSSITTSFAHFVEDMQGNIEKRSGSGRDFYTLYLSVDFLVLIYVTFGYYGLIGSTQGSFLEGLQQNLLPGPLVVAMLGLTLSMIADRIIYVMNSVRAKYVFHCFQAIAIHALYIGWKVANGSPKIGSGVTLYFIKFLYLYVCCAQIRNGFGAHRRHDPFTEQATLLFWLGHTIYRAVPFLFELRVLLDWSFARTSMRLKAWWFVEDVHFWVFNRFTDIDDDRVTNPKRGSSFPIFVRVYQGLVLFALLIFVLFFPLMYYSTFNPQLQSNQVTSLTTRMSLSEVTEIYRSTKLGFPTPGAAVLRNAIASTRPRLGSFNFNDEARGIQLIDLSSCSADLWAISPYTRQRLLSRINASIPIVAGKSDRDLLGQTADDSGVFFLEFEFRVIRKGSIGGQTNDVTLLRRVALPDYSLKSLYNLVSRSQRFPANETKLPPEAEGILARNANITFGVPIDPRRSIWIPNAYDPFLFNRPTGVQTFSDVLAANLQQSFEFGNAAAGAENDLMGCLLAASDFHDPLTGEKSESWCLRCGAIFKDDHIFPANNSDMCGGGGSDGFGGISRGGFCNFETTPPPNSSFPGLYFVALSEPIPSESGFLPNIGIIAIYTTFILTLFTILRRKVTLSSHRVVLEEIADPRPVAELVSYIYLTRSVGGENDLVLEELLYFELIDLIRSPEALLNLTGRRVKDYDAEGNYIRTIDVNF